MYTFSRNNQHNAQICTTALFRMLAPTCFGCSLASSESFWIRLSYVKIQIDTVVYPDGGGETWGKEAIGESQT
jgi:hypothetical protein